MRCPKATGANRRSGAAVVELAVLLPVLCFLFVISVDYARVFYFSLTLKNAARNGAYYASNYPGIYSYQTAQQVVTADVSNLSPPPTIEINYSVDANGPYVIPVPMSNGYVEVKVTWTFNSITRFPGVPATTTLVRNCRMKVAPITPNFP